MKIGILVVAYNAATTLDKVLDRIPSAFRPKITEVLVLDDHSQDATYLVGLGYQKHGTDLPLTIRRHSRNLGYGGNQKAGYRLAIAHGWDIVVLLHGDGQYAPELLPEIVAPLERGECDAVFGSRMMERGHARDGGMPLYKYAGNKILSAFQNKVAGTNLTEWHSGYRAYRVPMLMELPFENNSDGFNFDTQIILQLHDAGKRIVEIPIPTYYGDEICYVNGLRYARDIASDTLRYRLGKAGFGSGELGAVSADYSLKPSLDSSHGRIVSWMTNRPASRVLDLGCSSGALGAELRSLGHYVAGVDFNTSDEVAERLDRFVLADLEDGIPKEVGNDYDVIVAADVLEHVSTPETLLKEAVEHLAPGGIVIASVPNVGHWYSRSRFALGSFDYDQRGILDRTHLRFFTRKSFIRLARRCGLDIARLEATGLPIDAVHATDTSEESRSRRAVRLLDQLAINVWPTLFGYQFVCELRPSEANEANDSQ